MNAKHSFELCENLWLIIKRQNAECAPRKENSKFGTLSLCMSAAFTRFHLGADCCNIKRTGIGRSTKMLCVHSLFFVQTPCFVWFQTHWMTLEQRERRNFKGRFVQPATKILFLQATNCSSSVPFTMALFYLLISNTLMALGALLRGVEQGLILITWMT